MFLLLALRYVNHLGNEETKRPKEERDEREIAEDLASGDSQHPGEPALEGWRAASIDRENSSPS